jgi:hypothetical protein
MHNKVCPKVWNQWEFYLLFIIHMICSIRSPRHSMPFLSRFTMFVRILLNILRSTVPKQCVILCLRWRRSRILTAYTCAFRNPQNAKSRGLRSCDRGAPSTGTLLPIHRWGNMSSRQFLLVAGFSDNLYNTRISIGLIASITQTTIFIVLINLNRLRT